MARSMAASVAVKSELVSLSSSLSPKSALTLLAPRCRPRVEQLQSFEVACFLCFQSGGRLGAEVVWTSTAEEKKLNGEALDVRERRIGHGSLEGAERGLGVCSVSERRSASQ